MPSRQAAVEQAIPRVQQRLSELRNQEVAKFKTELKPTIRGLVSELDKALTSAAEVQDRLWRLQRFCGVDGIHVLIYPELRNITLNGAPADSDLTRWRKRMTEENYL
jgi:hypothetical protein